MPEKIQKHVKDNKFQTTTFAKCPHVLSWKFPLKTASIGQFPLFPQSPPPPLKRELYFCCRLAVFEDGGNLMPLCAVPLYLSARKLPSLCLARLLAMLSSDSHVLRKLEKAVAIQTSFCEKLSGKQASSQNRKVQFLPGFGLLRQNLAISTLFCVLIFLSFSAFYEENGQNAQKNVYITRFCLIPGMKRVPGQIGPQFGERTWIFSLETATAFPSSPDVRLSRDRGRSLAAIPEWVFPLAAAIPGWLFLLAARQVWLFLLKWPHLLSVTQEQRT